MSFRSTSPSADANRRQLPLAAGILVLIAAGVLVLIATAFWPPAALARTHSIAHQRTSNWAGYADTASRPLTATSSQWIQPSATCDQRYATYSSFWVGLGGFKHSSQALEQIGTEADCTGDGRSSTYAWYELLPSPQVRLKLAVHPGDPISARVTVRGHNVTLQIANLTTHHRFTKTITIAAPDQSSAEWIAEAPSDCISPTECRPLPLSDFGTVQFTHARATTAGGHTGTITDPAFQTTELTLSPGGPTLGPEFVAAGGSSQATPSHTTHHGGTFTVTSDHSPNPSTLPPLAAPDQLRHSARA